MRFLTDFADQAVILPLAVAVGLALLVAGWRRGALGWAIAVCGTLGAVLIAKMVAHACFGGIDLAGLRSPSGHTASAALVYGGLVALLLPAPLHRGRRLIAALLLGAAFAVAVGATRIALHVHTPSDVVAGACLGIAGVLALAWLAGPRPPELHIAAPALVALAIAVLLHGTHLHAEAAIDRLSCPIGPAPHALQAAAPPRQPGVSARP